MRADPLYHVLFEFFFIRRLRVELRNNYGENDSIAYISNAAIFSVDYPHFSYCSFNVT